MKWISLIVLLLIENVSSGEVIVSKFSNGFKLKCGGRFWSGQNDLGDEVTVPNEDMYTHYNCWNTKNQSLLSLTVKIRTCDNCIQLDVPSLSAVIAGNILATFFIAFAVYSISGDSTGKSFSGNKASDKVNLLNSGNGETDTYQPLNPGQSSEYSRLGGVRRT